MLAVQLRAPNELAVVDLPEPQAGAGEVVVAVRAAALNHRDVWIKAGQYAGVKWPCVPGSDGAGDVVGLGEGVDAAWLGREVVINPGSNWGDNERAQGASFSILGLPRFGTLAEKVVVSVAQLAAKPPHLSWTEAAALPLGGVTAFRALLARAKLQAGERVLISGIGGGVALLALQFARAVGAEVWVTSGSAEKIAQAVALGAKGGFNYREADWAAKAAKTVGQFAVVVDSAGGEGFAKLIDVTAPGGRVVFYGATQGDGVVPLRKVFWRQISVLGSTMGSPGDWQAMVEFVTARQVRPIVSDTFPLERAADAFARMERGEQFGKIVVAVRL